MKHSIVILAFIAFFLLPACAHFHNQAPEPTRKVASIPLQSKVEFPSVGVTVVMKDKSTGFPVAAIFDKNGDFYPEIQNKINKKMMESTQVGFNLISFQVHPENRVYKESRESYATLVIQATTLDGLNSKEKILKFAVPVERMFISQKGGKAAGMGYWNTTDVRALDPRQALPF